MDKDLLRSELGKARKRLVDQSVIVQSTQAIIDSDLSLPSLKKIAVLRLPKLKETLALTTKVVEELAAALGETPSTQLDIESAAPPVAVRRGR